jgi:hypothetical protein
VPGYPGWQIISPEAVRIELDGSSLVMTLTHRALWFQAQRGVLFFRPTHGDFRITATVRASKASDPSQPPGQDGTVQLGGVMARAAHKPNENYVFIVVGSDRDGLSVETKTTTANQSRFEGPAWDSASADLKLCRIGSTFTLAKRHAGTSEAWIVAATYDRPDMPHEMQVGLNIYTDSQPDLQVRYGDVRIEPLFPGTAC